MDTVGRFVVTRSGPEINHLSDRILERQESNEQLLQLKGDMPEDSLRVVARVKALPDRVDTVRSILLQLIEPTRREEGCVVYELLQNKADPTDFTFVEEWRSGSCLDIHAASAHLKDATEKLRGVIAEAPDIRKYLVVK
jgi:quinol monooxygenase YgiN